MLIAHEWLSLPMNVLAGVLAGLLRHLASEREAIWSFSPLFDLSIYHWIRRSIRKSFIDWQTSFFFLIIVLEFVRIQLHRIWPRRIFALDSQNWWVKLAIYAGTVMAVAIALKVLNNVRIEMKLEQQERLLLQARMEALQSQINPHFLFNTLNSVSSLVRRDPDSAREMIVKLGNILRRLLRKGDVVRPAAAKRFEFLDDYLDIEVVRFGRDKLQVVKGTRARLARPSCAEHDPAAAGGECRQARLGRRRSTAAASTFAAAAPSSAWSSRWKMTASAWRRSAGKRRHRHWHGERAPSACRWFTAMRPRSTSRASPAAAPWCGWCCRFCRRKRWAARWPALSTKSAPAPRDRTLSYMGMILLAQKRACALAAPAHPSRSASCRRDRISMA